LLGLGDTETPWKAAWDLRAQALMVVEMRASGHQHRCDSGPKVRDGSHRSARGQASIGTPGVGRKNTVISKQKDTITLG
jgi:hypothetical protein